MAPPPDQEIKPTIEDLLERNKQYATSDHTPIPTMMTRMKNDPKTYGPHTVVVSCLDSRSNPLTFLRLQPRECLVLRNVGGRFASAAPDIAALDSFFHVARVVLVQHTNCGASHVTAADAMDAVREKRPEFFDDQAQVQRFERGLPMHPDDWRELVRDLNRVKECAFLRRDLLDQVVGFWLDVETGLVVRVFPDGTTSKV